MLGDPIDIFYYVNQYESKSETDTNTVSDGLILYSRNLKLMRATCMEYGCKFVASVPHWVEVTDDIEFFDAKARAFFAKEDINYLDLQNLLPHNDFSIHSDRVHWTEEGLELMANIWFEKIIAEKLLGI